MTYRVGFPGKILLHLVSPFSEALGVLENFTWLHDAATEEMSPKSRRSLRHVLYN